MHLPQGLLERYPLGFYIISILASPKKNSKTFFFRKQLSPLIYVTSRAPILFKLGVLVVTFTRSIVRREYLPPPSPLPNFFFGKKNSPPQNYLTLNAPTLFKLTMILLYDTWVFVITTAQHLVYYFSL